ncbi:hypothetical protein L7F22_027501 [Adiantum nelumboides]|nr:hypothetical protein [Adiantum nelumboides]MCO5573727.1 hypothetical protein [Adiantum nelumboides]
MESKMPKRAKLVCRLCKALYGLKQGSRQLYLKFDKYMQSQGYERNQEDHCLYTKKLSEGSLIILIVYVDDMLIAGKSKDEIANLKKSLSTQFAMKDVDDANHFLGMRIKRDRQCGILELSQEHYVHKVLERFSMQGGNTLSTQMQPCLKLSKDDCPKSDAEKVEMAKVPYSSAVGSFMYAMVATRPDITFAIGVVNCEASIVDYTDADYAGCSNTRKSTFGYVFVFAGAAISWRSVLQTCTSSSTTKSEYVAASSASKEAVVGMSSGRC